MTNIAHNNSSKWFELIVFKAFRGNLGIWILLKVEKKAEATILYLDIVSKREDSQSQDRTLPFYIATKFIEEFPVYALN